MKPNCYECKHRGTIPGDAHSSCNHPSNLSMLENPLGQALSLLAGFGFASPLPFSSTSLVVKGDAYGIKNGWFNYPFNFDPTWLIECNGFEVSAETLEERNERTEAD